MQAMQLWRNAAILIAGATLAGAALAQEAANVNGKPIRQAVVDLEVRQAAQNKRNLDANGKKALVETLVNQELLAQEAVKAGYDKRAETAARLERAQQQILAATFIEDFMAKNPVSDAEVRAEYDRIQKALGPKEYKVRWILLDSDASAQDTVVQLSKGGDFAKLATERSKDAGTKAKGGELGWMSPALLPPALANAVTTLPKGLYNNVPIRTQRGWNIVKVDDVRDREVQPYDKVKDQLGQSMRQDKLQKHVATLREKAKITYAPEYQTAQKQ